MHQNELNASQPLTHHLIHPGITYTFEAHGEHFDEYPLALVHSGSTIASKQDRVRIGMKALPTPIPFSDKMTTIDTSARAQKQAPLLTADDERFSFTPRADGPVELAYQSVKQRGMGGFITVVCIQQLCGPDACTVVQLCL